MAFISNQIGPGGLNSYIQLNLMIFCIISKYVFEYVFALLNLRMPKYLLK